MTIQPAGPIPPEAELMMTERTVSALNAMDLDTPPSNPDVVWYCVSRGTWIGLHHDL